ncbi:translation initiation factor eIF-2B subunit epsilon [Capsicum annuum]|uniref:translation initiation factor eIF-2B subunit epsilon n=1 Tax=Capsicum annuum TaxID=4072 RepID=UPI001FB0F280|nr:translation initiation factor eIF-2B subunit epsilon [Capsicum annuum]
MGAKKGGSKGGGGGAEVAEEELARTPLQAIILADSFTTKFRPITLERPKVLLPLVNAPMIDYTLAWLESAGVEEVFVFCCAHSKQVIDYLDKSNWFDQPNFSVTTIESHNAISAGDALRLIYEQHVIRGDFILVSGDTVSNMSLSQALKEHKERRRKDSNAVMTMVIKQSKPSPITRQSRLGTEELFMVIDPETKQLLYYEDRADNLKGYLSLDKALLTDNTSISFQNDKQDCYIDICSPEVLSLFTDNFDYQHLRRDFVKGLLVDDIMGYKIYTHEIHSSYAARIDNYRSYDTISKDIIQRWTYPLVPDVHFFGNSATKLERQGMYRAPEIKQSHSSKIGPFTVIGTGTSIGNSTEISNSVIGEGCSIGSNVTIEGCYVWNNVTIEDGCKLKHSIVCDGVTMKYGATLEPGVVLSFKVVVGRNFLVPAYSKVSLLQQPLKQDSDEELEYADNSSGIMEVPSFSGTLDQLNEEEKTELPNSQEYEVGDGGVGFIWLVSEGGQEEEWRHSVAPVPVDKLVEIMQITNEVDIANEDGALLPPSGELGPDSITNDSNEDAEDIRDDSIIFEREVEATFQRAVEEDVTEDHIILEVNSLRLSYNMTSADCAGALFYSVMKLALDAPHDSPNELYKNVVAAVRKWKKLLKYYLSSIDEEIEVILKFEEMCLESTREYSSLFVQILHHLYDQEIIQEEAILDWASEKEGAEESDKVFVKQSEKFIQWLKEASEEEDED